MREVWRARVALIVPLVLTVTGVAVKTLGKRYNTVGMVTPKN
jgi:hypothetical protein